MIQLKIHECDYKCFSNGFVHESTMFKDKNYQLHFFILKSLNEALDNLNVPVEIVDGFVGSIAIAIPWSALINDSTALEIHNLELTIQPKKRSDSAGEYRFFKFAMWVYFWCFIKKLVL